MGKDGRLSGVEVFLFTDNSTAEAAFARGSSTTESLFDLVKRLKLMEMVFRARIHVIHISGKRMIAQGTDGLSRGCLTEGSTLCKYKDMGRNHATPHVVVPLMGRFKGETGERNVLRPLVNITRSGIPIRQWIDRLVRILIMEGRDDTLKPGPAFCDEKGFVVAYGYMNQLFHEELEKIQQENPDLIAPDVDICDTYNLHRSLRRGATSRANALNYTDTVINTNNRWRTTQSNKGKGGLTKMSQLYYVEISLSLDTLLEFSASLKKQLSNAQRPEVQVLRIRIRLRC